MFRVEYAAGISASARDRRPTLRRGLCQQTSRIALLSVIGLAAAGGASLLTPEEALADCKVGVDVQCLVSTDTTNTKYAGGFAVYRFYEGATGVPFTGSVAAGATIGGHGLAFGNIDAGGVNVVNEGVIRVDAGNVPTEGGEAALNLRAAGGALTYSGGGDITNAGVGDGLVAFQTGAGSIDLNISGDVSAAAGAGVFARHAGDGAVTVNVTGKVTGTDDVGIFLVSNRGVTLTVADTVTGAMGLSVAGGLFGSGDISVTGAGGFVGVNGDGVLIDNRGSGNVLMDVSGPITATGGDGVFVRNDSISGDINVTTGDVSVTGPAFIALDILSASETGNVTVTVNGALSGGGRACLPRSTRRWLRGMSASPQMRRSTASAESSRPTRVLARSR